jgi:TetR/AcrR family transcriptional regulator
MRRKSSSDDVTERCRKYLTRKAFMRAKTTIPSHLKRRRAEPRRHPCDRSTGRMAPVPTENRAGADRPSRRNPAVASAKYGLTSARVCSEYPDRAIGQAFLVRMPSNVPTQASAPALDRIFSAAERLFAERGFDSVSISDVAGAAGVCKANVFHHFASKRALYEAVLTHSCERLGDEIERNLAAETRVGEQIPHFLRWYRDYLRAHPSTARLLLREVTGNPDLAESGPVLPLLSQLVDSVVAHVRDARDAGVFRADANPAVVASLMLGVTLFDSQTEHLRRYMPALRDVSDEAYVDLLTDALLRGVRADNANANGGMRNNEG